MTIEAAFYRRWGMTPLAKTPGSWMGFDVSGDGYDWMDEAMRDGWRMVASWGRDGWDMGDWPYVVIGYRKLPDATYVSIQRIEGDLQAWHHTNKDTLTAHLDGLARRWWKRNGNGPGDLNSDAAKGWYSAARLNERTATNG